MRLGILGPLAVWTSDGQQVRLPERKVRALLANLLAHQPWPVSATRLVSDVWRGELPENPVATLQLKVSRLRGFLEAGEPGGRDLVVSQPPGYRLRVEAEAVDAGRFGSLTARARAAADPVVRAAVLADALALWRGPALADFADEPFAQPLIARLEAERLAALEVRAAARLEFEDHDQLIAELADLIAAHPLQEGLHATYLRALYRAGRQSEALASYRDLQQRLVEELGVDPSPQLAALHQAILRQDPALAAGTATPALSTPRPRTNVPEPLTELVGRADAVARVCALLDSARLVTLTGSGGVGKTRLALATASQLVERYPDGVWLVELAELGQLGGSDVASLAAAVLAVLDLREESGTTLGSEPGLADLRAWLSHALRGKRLLLVLDNCEHVVEPAAALVELLLRAAPGLRVLATSREPLALPGEVRWTVPPLEVPDHDRGELAAVARSSAVQLFVARARSATSDFALGPGNAAAVGTLCRRLDGLPLALELAATRAPSLGVSGLLDRLDDRFRLLAAGHRGAPPRQQTLRAVIDWSWELLNDRERDVLRRVAVHAASFTLEAAEQICTGGEVARADVADLLGRVVDRSLVMVVDLPSGPRYRLLESVGEYCLEQLRAAGELAAVTDRHHAYYLHLAEAAEPQLRGPAQREWLQRLDLEAATLRAVFEGLVRQQASELALRLANALVWYWFLRGRFREGLRSLTAALAVVGPTPPDLREVARAWQRGMQLLVGDGRGPAEVAAEEDASPAVCDAISDVGARTRARWFLGFVECDLGDLRTGEALVDAALSEFRALGDRWGMAAALSTRARQAMTRGDLAALRRDGERSMALFRELGDRWGQLQASDSLASLAEIAGEYAHANQMHADALRTAEQLELWPEVSGRLSWLGRIATLTGDYLGARNLHEQALRLAREQSYQPGHIFAEMGLGAAARREGRLDAAEIHLRHVLDRLPREEVARGNTLPLGLVLAELGGVAQQRGDAAEARARHLDGLAVARHLVGDPRPVALNLEGLAAAQALIGEHADSAVLLGAASAVRDAAVAPLAPVEQAEVDQVAAKARAALGAERYAAAFAHGQSLTPDGAAASLVHTHQV